MLFRGVVESADGFVSTCGSHTDIRSIVHKRPQADVPNASPSDHVVFPLPNSRLYHNQRNANIPVALATTLMCSSSWSMKYLIKPLMWQPCLHVHVHCFLPTAFALYMYATMRVILTADDNVGQLLFVVDLFMIVPM